MTTASAEELEYAVSINDIKSMLEKCPSSRLLNIYLEKGDGDAVFKTTMALCSELNEKLNIEPLVLVADQVKSDSF